jgi:hypothetical protein
VDAGPDGLSKYGSAVYPLRTASGKKKVVSPICHVEPRLPLTLKGRGYQLTETVECLEPTIGFVDGAFGWALASAGRTDEAREVLERLRARPAPAPAVVSHAWLLAALDELDEAWEVLEAAEQEHQPFLNLTGLPGFDAFRNTPRFDAFVERMGLPATPA